MRIDKKIYQEELFKRLFESPDIKKVSRLLEHLFEQSIFWIVPRTNITGGSLLTESLCPNCRGGKKKDCLDCFSGVIRRARKSRKAEQFVCPGGAFGICIPLVQGDAYYGSLIICHLKAKPSSVDLHLLEAVNGIILEKIQKELELSKLYQTIRPRAVALSTVHTIYRLLNSCLDLDELLPRIARLSLQVLRAKRCVISLVDKKTRRLVTKAAIDLSKKKTKFRLTPQIKEIEKKVLCSGNMLLKRSYLSLPLIEEEPIGVITVFQKITNRAFDNFDQEILTALSEQAVGAIRNAQLYREQENTLLGTVKSISTLLKVKSACPYPHSKAFMAVALGIGRELKFSEEQLRDLHFAAMLHDAGEIGIPEAILKKPRQLSGEEYQIIKEHPKKSVEILSPLERLKPAIAIIMHHHEKFDGTGYPAGLKGEKIPLGARIMAVADSFEAMTSRRPYRKSTSVPDAIKEIKKHSGTQFDPRVIEAFLKFIKGKSFEKLMKDVQYGQYKKDL
jgi:HD-GYP domain-containing protein (c-di-GMP phosphodiesterase class II)